MYIDSYVCTYINYMNFNKSNKPIKGISLTYTSIYIYSIRRAVLTALRWVNGLLAAESSKSAQISFMARMKEGDS